MKRTMAHSRSNEEAGEATVPRGVSGPEPARSRAGGKRTMTWVLPFVAVVVMAVPAAGREVARPGSPVPLATVGDQVITREEVENALRPQLDRIADRRQALLDQKLGQLIGERLLAQEARKRGLSVEALLAVEVDAKVPAVSDAEVAEFVKRNRGRFPGDNEAPVQGQVRDYLRRQKIERQRQVYLRELRARATVTLFPEGTPTAQALDSEQYARVAGKVLPADGYTLPIRWGDLGPTLVRLGAIDLKKFKALYGNDPARLPPDFAHLERPSDAPITITRENATFLVNVLWALGLANKSSVLERALADRGPSILTGLASTGGWTLGSRPARELYGKFEIVRLSAEQEALVADLAQSIYRPCCDNPTAFPDCNHGIALLGLIELMAANGLGRQEILRASLAFNSFWFPQQYLAMATLFRLRGIEWDAVDASEALGPRYSSLTGWTRHVDRELTKLAHLLPPQGEDASCGVSG